jgi:type I restriction enzyme, R subunit
MSPAFSESSTVQAWLVQMLGRQRWKHVSGKRLPRTHTDVLIEEWLIKALKLLNPALENAPERIDEVLPLIRSAVLAADQEGLVAANERLVTILRGTHTVKYVGTDEYVPLRLIDFDDLSNNDYVVAEEVTYGPPGAERRFDTVLYVNGIPVVVIETKTPVKASVSWLNGAKDIANVYTVEHPEFFATNILVAATEGREFHYAAVGLAAEAWPMWGSTADPYDLDDFPRVKRSVELLLTPQRVLSILRDFTLFDNIPGVGKIKLIPRYPQVEGAEAIFNKVISGGPGGLIWQYQGTGKTLLMAYAALMLLNDPRAQGPTVLVVLDRLDLIEQVERQFKTAGLPRLSAAGDRAELRRLLKEDRRGIITTTIHRFLDAGLLNERSNIIVLVDEAHRTTEGSLGDDMRGALPNARFFGLTGTPISDAERNTFKLFGDPNDPDYVLNSYSMERSIFDGTSVPVHVETRLVDFHLDNAALDEAFEQMADEEQLTDEQREFVASKAAHVKTILVNPERITRVCTDILDHFEAKVAPVGMKAQVVAFDRELVVAYEQELKRLIAERGLPHRVAVVMTIGTTKDEPPEWSTYSLTRDQEATIKREFNDPEDPLAFLIVTAKLLTGFDAPVEQVMYLDKPLRKHTLFQAITRTNRRFTNPKTGQIKRYGLVVDYIGLGPQIALALKAADPESGGKRPVDTDALAAEFAARMAVMLSPRFDGIDRADNTFEALQEARQRILTQQAREQFAKEFTGIQTIWEFLDPDPVLDMHKADYKWLAQVYESIKPTQVSNALLWYRLGQKTLNLVHGHISEVRITGTGLEEVVVDPDAIEAMRQLVAQGILDIDIDPDHPTDNPVTVDEVLTAIDRRIKQRLETGGNPVYRSLAEQIEKLRQHVIQNAADSIEFLKKALEVARLAVEAEKLEDQGKLDAAAERLLDPNIGALTQIVEEYKPDNTPVVVDDVVRDIDTIVKQVRYTGWNTSQAGDRLVRKELRGVLKKYALPLTGPLFDNAYAYVAENY